MSERRDARIELRLSEESKDLLAMAASYSGMDMTSFVMATVLPAAKQVVAQQNQVAASRRDVAFIARLLDNPPRPNAALKKAAAAWRSLHGDTPRRSHRQASRRQKLRQRAA
jgi:uncharacterized protein (DUF1778 family)